jgi:hypothetical protein
VQTRVDNWLDPWQDVSDAGFQTVQGTFALAFGGITGTGPGLGSPGRIPAAETDFIFAAIGEELGLLGTTAVLVSFLLMVGTGLRIALRADTPFDKLLAAGLTAILGIQSFIIIGGVIRWCPSPASRSRSCPTAARRSSPTTSSSPSSCGSPTRRPAGRRPDRPVNRQIRRLGVAMAVLFLALFVQLNVVQVFRADTYNDHPANTRAVTRDFNRPAGQIVAPDGTVLARSEPVEAGQFERQRVYPEGRSSATSPATTPSPPGSRGWRSPTTRSWPAGPRPASATSPSTCSSATPTSDVVLTIPIEVQRAARDALGDRPGLGRGARPPRRRRPGALVVPVLRPDTALHRRPGRRRRRHGPFVLADPGQPAAPPLVPGDVLPGLDVQGRDRCRRAHERRDHADLTPLPLGAGVPAAAHEPTGPQLRGRDLRRRARRHHAGLVQHRLRAARRRHGG